VPYGRRCPAALRTPGGVPREEARDGLRGRFNRRYGDIFGQAGSAARALQFACRTEHSTDRSGDCFGFRSEAAGVG
jgi:hypothetical protein